MQHSVTINFCRRETTIVLPETDPNDKDTFGEVGRVLGEGLPQEYIWDILYRAENEDRLEHNIGIATYCTGQHYRFQVDMFGMTSTHLDILHNGIRTVLTRRVDELIEKAKRLHAEEAE